MIEGLSEQKINMIIEGTGRTTEVPHHTAELLIGQSYGVELAAIAVRPVVSLCSTLLRFYKMNEGGTIPRATAMDAHDHVVAVLPDNLDKLNADPVLSRVTIWKIGRAHVSRVQKGDLHAEISSGNRRHVQRS